MKRRWLKIGILYLVSVAAVAALALWLGSIFGRHRAEAANEARRAELQSSTIKNLRGIEVGKRFPDLTVWSHENSHASQVRDLVPRGGLIAFLSSGSPQCVGALEALCRARATAGPSAMSVIPVVTGNAEGLAKAMRDIGLSLPIYLDAENAFVDKYGVKMFPTCFLLDDQGLVSKVTTGVAGMTSFAQIVSGPNAPLDGSNLNRK